MNDPVIRRILTVELHQFFHRPASFHLLPLLVPAIAAAVWHYTPSTVPVVVVTALLALEPHYNNILFRTPREFDALSLFPLDFQSVVLAKNIATILLTLLLTVVSACLVFYFAPELPSAAEIGGGFLYLGTMVFPLLQAGNTRSVNYPRRRTGWRIDDAAEAFGFLLVILVCSVPYLILGLWADSPLLCVVYAAGACFIWIRRSTTRTVRRILDQQERLCTHP